MDPTQTHLGSQLVPLSDVPVQPEAYESAPTLIAGETAGSQGQVEIWAPEKREIWKRTRGLANRFLFLCGVFLVFFLHHGHVAPIFLITWSIPMMLSALLALAVLRRPPYLTTDAAGMGIATWRGSYALRWSDICSVEVKSTGNYPRLKIAAPEPVIVRLQGHSPRRQQELLSLIIHRAHLQPHPKNQSCFIRAAELPAPGK